MMTRSSLPIRRRDGSVLIEPLQRMPCEACAWTCPNVRSRRGFNNTEMQPDKIFRDIAILILLAVTIVAGSAIIVGVLWHEVMLAQSQVPIIEAERATKVALAEAALRAASES